MLRIALELGATMPRRHSAEAAGVDLHYWGPSRLLWPSLRPILLSTGVHVEMPEGFAALVLPRSGMTRRGIVVVPGTIDSDYRGIIGVMVRTWWPRRVKSGERIAQLVPIYHGAMTIEKVPVAAMATTARGEAGYGSTGRE